MASEDFVSFNIMRYFQKIGWHILQYHSPGGQACLALKIVDEIVYPDLIAYFNGKIIVLENKSKFSNADIQKLRKMSTDNGFREQIIDVVKSFLKRKGIITFKEYKFYWGHGYSGRLTKECFHDINLFFVSNDGSIMITEAIDNPDLV